MQKKLSVQQNMLYNSIGSLVYLGCQWLITVLVVKLASYTEAGNLSLAISLTNMFFTFASFGIRNFQVSDLNNEYSVSTYIVTRIATSICAFSACAIIVGFNAHYTTYQIMCILTYMIFRVAEAFVDVLQGIQQKSKRMDYICISFIARGILTLVSFCIVLYLTQKLLFAIISMAIISFIVVIGYDLPICKRLTNFKLNFDFKSTKSLLLKCFPLMCNSFLLVCIVSIPKSILENVHGNYYLGIYSSIATPAVIVQTAAGWIYNPLVTVFTEHYINNNKDGYRKQYKKVWCLLIGIFAIILVVAKFLGPWGLSLLFGKEIVEYSYLLIPVLITTAMIALIYFLNALLTISRCLKTIVISNGISVLIVAIFSKFMIEKYFMSGVNYIIIGAAAINIIILVIAVEITSKKHFNKN